MATTKVSLNDKNYTFPDTDGYVPVGTKASVGSSTIPLYLTNGKLQPITSYSGTAANATKVRGDKFTIGDCYLTGTTSATSGYKETKILPTIKATVAGPAAASFKQTCLTIGNEETNSGAIKLYDGKKDAHTATFFVGKLTEDREYYLPDKDGDVALVNTGNDYAEFRQGEGEILPGQVVKELGDGKLALATERLERGCEIVSDVYAFSIGETDECQLPIAIAGRVLAYPDTDISTFEIGAPVCSGENGTVSQMTEEEERLYPSRIIGTVSEIPTYDTWNNIPVNGRIWIRVR